MLVGRIEGWEVGGEGLDGVLCGSVVEFRIVCCKY